MLKIWKRKALRVDPLRQDELRPVPSLPAQSSQHGTSSLSSVELLLDQVADRPIIVTTLSRKDQLELCAHTVISGYTRIRLGKFEAGNLLVVSQDSLDDVADCVQNVTSQLHVDPILVSDWRHLTCGSAISITTLSCLQDCITKNGPLEPSQIRLLVLLSTEPRLEGLLQQLMGTFEIRRCKGQHGNISRFLVISRSSVQPQYPANQSSSKDSNIDGMAHLSRPEELVVFYQGSQELQNPTHLFQQLKHIDPEGLILERHFRRASLLTHTLGSYAADIMWQGLGGIGDGLEPISDTISERRPLVTQAIRNARLQTLRVRREGEGCNITAKVTKLIDFLEAYLQEMNRANFIIWVRQSLVADTLEKLLRSCTIHSGQLRPAVAYGHGRYACRQYQENVITEFLTRKYNVLVVTGALDDFELPSASCVIRFDMADSTVSYASSWARARLPGSHLILMAERDNGEHRRILNAITGMDPGLRRWVHGAHALGSTPPPSTLHESVNPNDQNDHDEDAEPFMCDPTTSRRIYQTDALKVVYRVVAGLGIRSGQDQTFNPLFIFEPLESSDSDNSRDLLFSCHILIPSGPSLPPKLFKGPPSDSMSLARRMACYELCASLFQRGLLDYRLFPRSASGSVSVVPEASYSINSIQQGPITSHQPNAGTDQLYLKKYPDFWQHSRGVSSGLLFPVTVSVAGEAGDQFHPLLLLTRFSLPPIPLIKLFFRGSIGEVRLNPLDPVSLDPDHMALLHQYTERLFRLLMNKAVSFNSTEMGYFVAPTRSGFRQSSHWSDQHATQVNGSHEIDWKLVSLAVENITVPVELQDLADGGFVRELIVQERPGEFTRRYEVCSVCSDLSPGCIIPLDAGGNGSLTFLSEALVHRKGFTSLQDPDQPLLKAQRIQPLSDHLSPMTNREPEGVEMKYFIPELCYRLTIHASVMRLAALLPSILRRLDDILLVKELNSRLFDHRLSDNHLHAALTASSAMMDFNYERLELLGDAFLKYFSSAFLFVSRPYQTEGVMHLMRQRLISNVTLRENAIRCGIPSYAQTRKLVAKIWKPYWDGGSFSYPLAKGPMASPEGRGAASGKESGDQEHKRQKRNPVESGAHYLNDKCIADIVEAIIGASLLSHGREEASWVAKRLLSPIPPNLTWTEIGRQAALIRPPVSIIPLSPRALIEVEGIVGRKFTQPLLLAQALNHHTNHRGCGTASCFERLEFVGDAILEILTVSFIFEAYPEASPGTLTLLKSAMVTNSTLAAICVHLGLHNYLTCLSNDITSEIDAYAHNLLRLKEAAGNNLNHGAPDPPGQYWLDLEPPKALSDVIESILGALFLDELSSPLGAERFFQKELKPFFVNHIDVASLSQHPTNMLFEYFQSRGCRDFRISKSSTTGAESSISSVVCHNLILAKASDVTIQAAARRCSVFALEALRRDPAIMDICDCRPQGERRRKRARVEERDAT